MKRTELSAALPLLLVCCSVAGCGGPGQAPNDVLSDGGDELLPDGGGTDGGLPDAGGVHACQPESNAFCPNGTTCDLHTTCATPHYSASNGVVKEQVTGLIWQQAAPTATYL